jgi:hypothetical protein
MSREFYLPVTSSVDSVDSKTQFTKTIQSSLVKSYCASTFLPSFFNPCFNFVLLNLLKHPDLQSLCLRPVRNSPMTMQTDSYLKRPSRHLLNWQYLFTPANASSMHPTCCSNMAKRWVTDQTAVLLSNRQHPRVRRAFCSSTSSLKHVPSRWYSFTTTGAAQRYPNCRPEWTKTEF